MTLPRCMVPLCTWYREALRAHGSAVGARFELNVNGRGTGAAAGSLMSRSRTVALSQVALRGPLDSWGR